MQFRLKYSHLLTAVITEYPIDRQLAQVDSYSHPLGMLDWLKRLLLLISDLAKLRSAVEVEITALRQRLSYKPKNNESKFLL